LGLVTAKENGIEAAHVTTAKVRECQWLSSYYDDYKGIISKSEI
jgi:hypothetical protein